MNESPSRRSILRAALLSGLGLANGSMLRAGEKIQERHLTASGLKLSLNAYSFNRPLSNGEMDLFELVDFCADHGLSAIDPTSYYFPGYPEVPDDSYLFEFKRKVAIQGLEISGTGIRNDFSNPDGESRKADVDLISRWVMAASKIGAPLLRIFAGKSVPENYSKKEVMSWMIDDFKTCAEVGRAHGVMIAMQNHDDFIKNSDEIIELMEAVHSPWFGLHLDIGSFSERDPYEEIRRVLPYALTFQIKEFVTIKGEEEPVDLERLFTMIAGSGYRGYLPLETLGPDAPDRVPAFVDRARSALEKVIR